MESLMLQKNHLHPLLPRSRRATPMVSVLESASHHFPCMFVLGRSSNSCCYSVAMLSATGRSYSSQLRLAIRCDGDFTRSSLCQEAVDCISCVVVMYSYSSVSFVSLDCALFSSLLPFLGARFIFLLARYLIKFSCR